MDLAFSTRLYPLTDGPNPVQFSGSTTVSVQTTFDLTRNQIARTIDVMLEPAADLQWPLCKRNPDKSYFVLLTPEMFRKRPKTRLYGWLMNECHENPHTLGEHIPWRASLTDWYKVTQRMAWLTWEDCQRIVPTACPWLHQQEYNVTTKRCTWHETNRRHLLRGAIP